MPLSEVRSNASSLHRAVFAMVVQAFPSYTVLQEEPVKVRMPDGRETTVFVDMYVKELNLAIECHGRQHDEFVAHFHGTQASFQESKARDAIKKQTLIEAGVSVLVLREHQIKKLTRLSLQRSIQHALEA